jgi:hypothetical protein
VVVAVVGQCRQLTEDGIIAGGMIPKVRGGALGGGAGCVCVCVCWGVQGLSIGNMGSK